MKPLCILNVEDDDVDRENMRRLLTKTTWPIDLHEASSFAEAKVQLQANKFDCVFLDYSLGDGTGFDVIPAVQHHRNEVCPIIMVSTNGNQQLVVEAMREGVYDYITKSGMNKEQLQKSIDGSLHWVARETELRESRRRIEYLSMYDSLTGLPNRTLLFDRLSQQVRLSERNETPFSLFMMDLNLFKEVNDGLGHDVGDAVLREVARRLSSVVRHSDTVARLGGDEFACLLPSSDTHVSSEAVAEKIAAAINAPIFIGHDAIRVSISIGIAHFPAHAHDGDTLLKRADHAMYEAKRGARGIQMYASHPFASDESPSVLLGARLERAIQDGELQLYFQPQICLDSGKIVGKEALVRWMHPELGLLMPQSFIPAAEKSHVITDLTYAVLQTALDDEQVWRAQGVNLPVSVNLSPRVLDDEALPAQIMEMLSARQLPPDSLTLELTETALFSAPLQALSSLRAMSEAGLRISIDDFGSGYTSFKQLRELEIAEIKIDGLFVKNIISTGRDASIVRSIVELGRGFDIQVIAECVERKESWQLLQDLGCRYAQGFSIGRPMPRADFQNWAQGWSPEAPIVN
jgi:diguanylate cyclase (GGDEF)-like protein